MSQPAASSADNLRGAGFMVLAMAGFALNDATMKLVLAEVPLMPAIFLRGVAMSVGLLALCWATGAQHHRPGARDTRLMGLRAGAEVAATICFLTALASLPIATATAILQSTPLVVTLGAALVLGEPVGWRRGVALLIGLAGVVLIVRPGAAAFDAHALYAVAAVAFIATRDLSTRRMGARLPSALVALVSGVAVTLAAGLAAAAQPWPAVTPRQMGLMTLAAAFLIVGFIFAVRAMRVGEVAFAAPFRYSILLFAIVLGLVLFGEVPDGLTLAGAALIVGSGLFTFWREQALARRGRLTRPRPRPGLRP